MKKSFAFKAEVWKYPGNGGWHFVNVPDVLSKKIRKKYGKGMIKIEAGVAKSKWKTSLFPFTKPTGDMGYLISIKGIIRMKEEIFEGDKISIKFSII